MEDLDPSPVVVRKNPTLPKDRTLQQDLLIRQDPSVYQAGLPDLS
jgi:hypothetical protein